MRQRITRLVLVLIACGGLLLHPGGAGRPVAAALGGEASAAATRPDWDGLLAKVRPSGSLAVIVGLHVLGHAPLAGHPDEAALQAHQISLKQAQDALMSRLAGQNLGGVKQFEQIPFVAMRVDEAGLLALRTEPLVSSVAEDLIVAPALEGSVPLVRADLGHWLSYRGAGQAIAILDSGVDRTHPDLEGRVVSEACYSTTDPLERRTTLCPSGQFSQVGAGAAAAPSRLIDGFDHGTHVAAIAARAAPDADLIAIQVVGRIDDGTAANQRPCADVGRRSPCVLSRYSDLILGLQRVFNLRTTYSIAAVNMSLGGGGYNGFCDNVASQTALKSQIDILRSFGIPTVIAAGNSGHATAIGAPACISSAISVGNSTTALDPAGSDRVSPTSNVSSALTMFAPGTPINAAVPQTTVTCGGGRVPDSAGRCFKGGTSMAAPHVAGALAVLRSAAPSASVSQLIDALTTSAAPRITDPRSGIARPRLDVYRSLCRLVPCDPDDFRFLGIGDTFSGVLSFGDSSDTYFLNGSAGSQIAVVMNRTSGTLDPFVSVWDPDNSLIAFNNNGGGGVNARVNQLILPRTGRYRIVAARAAAGNGSYSIGVGFGPANQIPAPFARALQPASVTEDSDGLWVQVDGANFIAASEARVNGSPRPLFFSSSARVFVWLYATDLTSAGGRTITVTNPGPGGGTSSPLTFTVTPAFNGASVLLAPAGREAPVGRPVTFAVAWTHPTASWRNTQNIDLKLEDEALNTVLWLRFTEGNPVSTVALLGGEGTPIVSNTLVSGQLGADIDLVVTDTVTLNLGQTRFFGSGQTVTISPTVTFGPSAVGAYTIRLSVDDDAEQSEVQDADAFGRFRVLPQGCAASLTDVSISGPSAGVAGTAHTFTAGPSPIAATVPISYTWSPEPERGQGTASATYRWAMAGAQVVGLVAANCGDFAGAVQTVAVHTTTAPDLALLAAAPPFALPGEPITYTLRLTNSGASAAGDVSLVAKIPAGASYVSGGTRQGDTVRWTIPSLAGSGAAEQRSFVVTAPATIRLDTYAATASGGSVATGGGPVETRVVSGRARLSPLEAAQLSAGAGGLGTTIAVPGGAVFAETELVYIERSAPARPYPAWAQLGGRAFALSAAQGDAEVPELTFGEAVTITLQTGAALPLERLTLYRWDGARWSDQGISCAPGGPGWIVCSATDIRTGEFALLTRPIAIFLPLAAR